MSVPKTSESAPMGAIGGALQGLLDGAIGLLPRVAMCVAILLTGAILARVARRGVADLVDRLGIEALAERAGVARLLYRAGMHGGVAALSGQLARVAVWLITIYMFIGQLQITGLTRAVELAFGYVPRLVVAGGLGLAGLVSADFLRRIIEGGEEAGATRRFGAGLVYYLVLTLTGSVILEQLGFDIALIHGLIEAVFLAVSVASALLFAWGARATFEQLVARHWMVKMLRVADQIQVGEYSGEVVRFAPLNVVIALDTPPDGAPEQAASEQATRAEVLMPYHTLLTTRFTLIEREEPDEPGASSDDPGTDVASAEVSVEDEAALAEGSSARPPEEAS